MLCGDIQNVGVIHLEISCISVAFEALKIDGFAKGRVSSSKFQFALKCF